MSKDPQQDQPGAIARTADKLKNALTPAKDGEPKDPAQAALERQKERDKADLEDAPEYVRQTAERLGGDAPRAAPKATDGVRTGGDSTATAPELAPAPPPAEFRAAPTHPGDRAERESWPDAAVSLEDAEKDGQVRVRTRDANSAGLHVGSVFVTATGGLVDVAQVRLRGAEHLRALLTDPRIQVTRKK